MMRMIIDTDIGDDIDDALAIAWALKRNIKLEGITTVYRDAEKRSLIVERILKEAGREDIPVYVGYSETLSPDAKQLGKLNYEEGGEKKKSDGDEAVSFIIECAEKYGEELTLLAVGPLTNLAIACMKAPESMKKIGQVVVMGGAFYVHTSEWNIACDPRAAQIVTQAGLQLTYVPWDVTRHIDIGVENYKHILETQDGGVKGYISGLVNQWKKPNGFTPLLHDPAAVYYCINPQVFETKDIPVKVIVDGEMKGLTLNLSYFFTGIENRDEYPRVKVVTKTDNKHIVTEFMKDVFEKEN